MINVINNIKDICVGTVGIKSAYLGSDLVYQKGGVTPSLPYDAEIEYLESNGTQFINTGIAHTEDKSYTLDIEITSRDSSYRSIIGAAPNGNGAYFFLSVVSGGSYMCNSLLPTTIPNGKVQLLFEQSNGNITLYVNDTFIATKTCPFMNYTLFLFARNVKDAKAKAKIYGFTVYDNSNIIMDFIPVRVGTTGYMYDKVSGVLFSNYGTGNFILGPDKN